MERVEDECAHVEREQEGGWQIEEESRGCWGREKRIAEADDFFLWPSRMLNGNAAGRSWGCTSEWYIFTCALNTCAFIWQDQIVAADTKQVGDKRCCESLFCHIRSRKCQRERASSGDDRPLLSSGMQQWSCTGSLLNPFHVPMRRNMTLCLPTAFFSWKLSAKQWQDAHMPSPAHRSRSWWQKNTPQSRKPSLCQWS